MNLTVASFLAYSGYTSQNINLPYLNFLLNNIEDTISDNTHALFSLTNITITSSYTNEFDYYGANTDLIKIGAWQSNNLQVQIGSRGVANPTPLILDQDYRIVRYRDKFIPTQANPVIAIKMLSSAFNYLFDTGFDFSYSPKLTDNQFVRLRGVIGWSNGLPDELERLLYELVKEQLEGNKLYTDSGGRGMITEEQSLNFKRKWSFPETVQSGIRDSAKNIMSNPAALELINKYKQYTVTQARIS